MKLHSAFIFIYDQSNQYDLIILCGCCVGCLINNAVWQMKILAAIEDAADPGCNIGQNHVWTFSLIQRNSDPSDPRILVISP